MGQIIILTPELEREAYTIALKSKGFMFSGDTCIRPEDNTGDLLSAQERLMLEGQFGEKVVKQYFLMHGIEFGEDDTPYTETNTDKYDFLVKELKIDVKTRTKPYHTRLIEKARFINKLKDVYISVRLMSVDSPVQAEIVGWAYGDDIKTLGVYEDLGYGKPTYGLRDNQLRTLSELLFILQ